MVLSKQQNTIRCNLKTDDQALHIKMLPDVPYLNAQLRVLLKSSSVVIQILNGNVPALSTVINY